MGLFSFFRKNKQESASGQGEFFSRSAAESATTRHSNRNVGNARKSGKAGKEDAADPVLPEKKRARRRLIGAVALVLAVVIVLPMILDSEPRPLGEDIAIQIPSRNSKDADADKSTQSAAEPKEEIVDPATMSAGGEKPAIAPGAQAIAGGPAGSASSRQAEPVPPVAEKPAEKPEPKPVPKAEPKPAEPKADARESKAAAKPSPRKEEPKKDVKDIAKPKAAEKSDDSARALAILEGKTAATDKKHPPAQAAGGKFVIQVAALATQEKVDELRGKLSSAGIRSYTQKVATRSGDRTRIRVGPFASRDEADKMRARISKLGLNATIVPA